MKKPLGSLSVGMPLRLRLSPLADTVYVLNYGGDTYKNARRHITDVRLIVRHLELVDNLQMQLVEAARLRPYVYAHTRTVTKLLAVEPGAQSMAFNYISQGQLPSRVVIGFVRSDGLRGKVESNPFLFSPFAKISRCYLLIGSDTVPREALFRRPYNFDEGRYAMAYFDMVQTLNPSSTTQDVGGITPKQFRNTHTLFCFDLTPSSAADFSAIGQGAVQVVATFDEPVGTWGLTAVCTLEIQSCTTIDATTGIVSTEPAL